MTREPRTEPPDSIIGLILNYRPTAIVWAFFVACSVGVLKWGGPTMFYAAVQTTPVLIETQAAVVRHDAQLSATVASLTQIMQVQETAKTTQSRLFEHIQNLEKAQEAQQLSLGEMRGTLNFIANHFDGIGDDSRRSEIPQK